MTGLERKDNRGELCWITMIICTSCLCCVNVILSIYVIVIYDGMCIRDMVNILCGNISNNHENIVNIMSTGGGGAWR